MSRNRSNTRCWCGFWSFATRSLSVHEPTLFTWERYCQLTGRTEEWSRSQWLPDGVPGLGFDVYRNGREDRYWTRRDGSGGTNYPEPGAGYPEPRAGYVYDPWVYAQVPPEQRYRFRCERCPVCRRMYLVYYVLQPWLIRKPYGGAADEPQYTAYDTSYWWSFNDEPSEDDLIDVLCWSDAHVAKALQEYAARHPELTTRSDGSDRASAA